MLILKFILTVLILLMIAKITNVKQVDRFKIEYSIVVLGAIILMYFNSDVVEYSLHTDEQNTEQNTKRRLQTLLDKINKLNANGGILTEDVEIDGNVEIDGTLSFGENSSVEFTEPHIEVKVNSFTTNTPFFVDNLELYQPYGNNYQNVRARNLIGYNSCVIHADELYTYVLAQRKKFHSFRNFNPGNKYENLTFGKVKFGENVAINTLTSPNNTRTKDNVCNGDWYMSGNAGWRIQKHDHNVNWNLVRSTRKEAIDSKSDCKDGPQENDYQPVTSQAYTSANDQLLDGTDYPSLESQRYGPCFDNTDCVNYSDICRNNKCVNDDD